MERIPNHIGRTAEEIISKNTYFDAPGYIFRAMSWLDYVKRTGELSAFYYASIDARLGIEQLFFELLVICSYPSFDEKNYRDCVKHSDKLDKILNRLEPDYVKLQEFTNIVISLQPEIPRLSVWNIKELRKAWGIISRYLHWCGASSQTVENEEWKYEAIRTLTTTLEPIWEKLTSGRIGAMQLNTMPQQILDIWSDFKSGKIDQESVKIRLDLAKSL